MKRITVIATIVFMVATNTVAAMSPATSVNLSEIRSYAPNANLSSLTRSQIGSLMLIIHGGDSEGEKSRWVRAFLLKHG